MKRAMVLAFVLVVACGATAAALAKPSAKTHFTATQALNCKSTMKIAFVTPLTGRTPRRRPASAARAR